MNETDLPENEIPQDPRKSRLGRPLKEGEKGLVDRLLEYRLPIHPAAPDRRLGSGVCPDICSEAADEIMMLRACGSPDYEWHEKVWGKTRCVVESDRFQQHELEVEEGGVCSFHYHGDRANKFVVKSGVVRIVWALGWEVSGRDLSAGETMVINSLVPHQFQVIEAGEMIEEYWPDRGGFVETDDIVRLTIGVKLNPGLIPKGSSPVVFDSDASDWSGSREWQ